MAVTVEELQILLSCDAAQAEAVLDAITKKVDSAVKKMQGKLDGAMDGGGTGGSKKQTSYYDALVKKISTAREKMNEALSGMQAGTEGADVNYNHWSQQVDSLTKRLEKLRDTQKDVNETAAEMRDIPIQYPQQSKGGYQPWSRPVENWQATQERSRDAMRYIESDQRQASRVDTEKLAYGTPYEKLHEQFVRASEKVDELAAKLRQLQEEGGSPKAIDALESKLETASNKADRLAEKMAKIEDKATGGTGGASETISETGKAAQEATPPIEEYNRAMRDTGAAGNETSRQLPKASAAIRKHANAFSKLGAAMKRILLYRILRQILQSIVKALKEGMENAYKFSKSASGDMAKFGTAMDSIKSSSLTMKNQLGAAFAGMLSAIAPAINAAISLITRLASVITQLFALMGGSSTYMAAVSGLDATADAAGGAGGAVKGLLADFDELNVIGQQGGGGGGGSGIDPSQMFEEQPVAPWLSQLFDESHIQQAIERLKKSWEEFVAAFNNGDFSKFIQMFLLDPLRTVIDTLDGIIILLRGIMSGDLWVVDMAIGKLIFDSLMNTVVIPFTRTIDYIFGTNITEKVLTFKDNVDNGFQTLLSDDVRNAVKEKIRETFQTAWNKVKEIWEKVSTWFNENVVQPIVNFFSPIVERISGFFRGCWIIIKAIWIVASTWFNEHVVEPIKKAFETVKEAVSLAFSMLWALIKKPAIEAALWMIEHVVEPIAVGFAEAWDMIRYGADVMWWGIKQVFAGGVNAVIDILNAGISMFNTAASWAAKTIGDTWEEIAPIPKIATEAFATVEAKSSEAADAVREKFGGMKDFLNRELSADPSIRFHVSTTGSANAGGSGGGTINIRPTINVAMAMATGGLAYGETLARIGEYPNARSNPEVVAPLDKLQGILERTGGGSNSKDVREQNALLREQNRLLQIIAKKKLEVSPTPELGQVVTKAQALYGEV